MALLLVVARGVATAHAQEPPAGESGRSIDEILPVVNQYCGSCHAVPRPDVLPRRSWPAVIKTMAEISQARMGRVPISERQLKDITAFYYGSSPEALPTLPYIAPSARSFVSYAIGSRSTLPYITNVSAARLTESAELELLVCDGEAKRLFLLTRRGGEWREVAIAQLEIPVHTQVVDIDADGDADILAADLGQFPPLDALAGKLFLLRQVAPGKFTKELIEDQLGRVSDARALDLDADGDLDVAVAVFGGGDVGEVFWLENTASGKGTTTYVKHTMVSVPGAINVAPADLNGDGRLDLVSLIAQEHEMIVAFVNRGAGNFEKGVIARAPHPMYGSTSLSTVDLDGDGDSDILFTNGDAFDAQTDPKPYHGVQWLENKGQLRFEFHDIGRLYGASHAAAGDMDGDGDLDVVAGSWLNFWNDPKRYALIWYENDGNQRFTPQGIAHRPAGLTSLQLIDMTGDGALDIVASALRMDLLLAKLGYNYKASRLFPSATESDESHPRVVVFENPGAQRSAGPSRSQ